MKWCAMVYRVVQWYTMELKGESNSHLIWGDSRGEQSILLQQCVDSGDHIVSNNSACDDEENIVKHLSEETLFYTCYGRGIVWCLGEYSDSPQVHGDESQGVVYSSNIEI